MKSSYSYIRELKSMFIPRTPGAALQAASEEILPIEAFVYKSTALNPMLKKPFNLDEIDWLLSRKDRDLDTNLILKTVLDELSRNEDKEIALFGAESLNALEKEYNSVLMELKEQIGKDNKPEDRCAAAELYYQLALLNKDESTLSNFYMKEAYHLLESVRDKSGLNFQNTKLLCQVLFHLCLFDQAEQLLPEGKEYRLLRLEIYYGKKDMSGIQKILDEIHSDGDALPEEKDIYYFWTGNHG